MTERPRMKSPRAVHVALFGACMVVSSCHRHHSSLGQPAPSESAVTLGIAIGTCDDIPTCTRECEAGSADRCRRLAASYAFGKGDAGKDESRAAALYEHACDMNDPASCMFAGHMSEYGRGVRKDDAKAARLYGRACDLHWVGGCYNLAIMFERGAGVEADEGKAAALLHGACDAGSPTACQRLGELKARPLVRRALEAGAFEPP
jgi:Sel1 repeat